MDAIDKQSPDALREELGDLLLQIVFQSEIAQDEGWFGIDDVVDAIADKMTRRHPWVFGDETVGAEGAGIGRWEEIVLQSDKKRANRGYSRRGARLSRPSSSGARRRKSGKRWLRLARRLRCLD